MLPNSKKIVIIGGGTNSYVANHLAISAPAYGTTARDLAYHLMCKPDNKMETRLYLTNMASQGASTQLDTPEDVESLVDKLIADPDTRVIIFNAAIVDYKPTEVFKENAGLLDLNDNEWDTVVETPGKYESRISSRDNQDIFIACTLQDKIIQKIRKERKDIFLVSFKTTCGANREEQFKKGLLSLKESSSNIVFVNDTHPDRREQSNGFITPEESSYWYETRHEALSALIDMILLRTNLHFTRSTVVDAELIPWTSDIIPKTFKNVVDYCIEKGAYKEVGQSGATVGHMGLKLGSNEFLTTIRKTNFNHMKNLVRVITDDPDDVFGYKHYFKSENDLKIEKLVNLAVDVFDQSSITTDVIESCWFDFGGNFQLLKEKYQDRNLNSIKTWRQIKKEIDSNDKVIAFGRKPSVGGQSQRTLFDTYPDLNCIVHFHCPLNELGKATIGRTSQFSFECGSKECIASNLLGFREFKVSDDHSIWCGHMDNHGPNIVFNSDIDSKLVIDFINTYWDLSKKTTGLDEDLI